MHQPPPNWLAAAEEVQKLATWAGGSSFQQTPCYQHRCVRVRVCSPVRLLEHMKARVQTADVHSPVIELHNACFCKEHLHMALSLQPTQ